MAGIALLGACTSQPSAKAVAKDVVESLPDLTTAQRTCMIGKIDVYSSEELQAIGEANIDVNITGPNDGTEQMQKFMRDLASCRQGG